MANRGFFNHIWYKLLDEEGVPLSGVNVWIYEALNPTTEIVLYGSPSPSANITQPLVTTSGGVFEFYVQDDIGVSVGASGHYPWDTEYLISWSDGVVDKSGIITGDALFGRFAQVNESSYAASSTRVNKAMSNYLGWVIQDHIEFQFGTTDRCGSSSSSSSSVSFSSSSESSSSISSVSSSSESSSSESSSSTSTSFSSSSSGIVPSGGLYDATWAIGANVLDSSPLLVDGDLLTAAETGAKIEEDVAYGISFDGVQRVMGLDIYCITSGTSVEQDQLVKPRTGYRFQAQYSNDNSTWNSVSQYGADQFPSTSWYQWTSILDKGAGTFVFRLPFAAAVPSASHFIFIDVKSETLSVSAAGGSVYPLQVTEIKPMSGRCTEDGWVTALSYINGNDVIFSDLVVPNDQRVFEGTTNGAILYTHHSRWINPYGKYYWEVVPSGGTNTCLMGFFDSGNNTRVGYTPNSWGFYMQSSNWNYVHNSSFTTLATAYSSGQVLQFAVDQIERKAWLGVNGIWLLSGNPETGANPLWSNIGKGCLVAGGSTWSIGHKFISYFKESQMNYSIPSGFVAPVTA